MKDTSADSIIKSILESFDAMYESTYRNPESIPWTGPKRIPSSEATSEPPGKRLQPEQLERHFNEQGIRPIEELFWIVFQIGFDCGMNERKKIETFYNEIFVKMKMK